jgi:hypothetical protein
MFDRNLTCYLSKRSLASSISTLSLSSLRGTTNSLRNTIHASGQTHWPVCRFTNLNPEVLFLQLLRMLRISLHVWIRVRRNSVDVASDFYMCGLQLCITLICVVNYTTVFYVLESTWPYTVERDPTIPKTPVSLFPKFSWQKLSEFAVIVKQTILGWEAGS